MRLKDFWDFEPFCANLATKFAKCCNFLSKKFNVGSKNADFDADFKSVEKVAKRPTRKNLEG